MMPGALTEEDSLPKRFHLTMPSRTIAIRGARTHNLKNVSVEIPQRQLTVLTGPSGSGKSSLAFNTLYAEGQRRFVESMSTYVRQFLERIDRPDVDEIEGILPAIAIEQRNTVKNARSTVATATELPAMRQELEQAFTLLDTPIPPGARDESDRAAEWLQLPADDLNQPNDPSRSSDWRPTHRVGTSGLDAWESQDGGPPVARLDSGLEVLVEQTDGGWARVVCENGWSAWVDRSGLDPRS